MKITKEKIDRVSQEAKMKGVDVRLRDIGYYVIAKVFDSVELAYRMVFETNATDTQISAYDGGATQTFVKDWFKRESTVDGLNDDLTFTENRQALIDMLNEITELAQAGEIPQKDAMKMKTDIRVKLTDKFQIQDSGGETIVVVPPKFDFVCPHTSRECYQMNAEYAKRRFHLIDDPDYTGDE